MALLDDIQTEVRDIVRSGWSERDGRVIPEPADVGLETNDAVKMRAAVLFADLAGSTAMVDRYYKTFSAKVFKSFLIACARVVQFNEGQITAYDGDRLMAVFIGARTCSNAARAALAVNWAMLNIVNPQIKEWFRDLPQDFQVRHGIGVDVGDLFIVRTGVRIDNDLAWIGGASNWAAKMSTIREHPYQTFISEAVYNNLADDAKFLDGTNMWEVRTWNGRTVYRSSYWRRPYD